MECISNVGILGKDLLNQTTQSKKTKNQQEHMQVWISQRNPMSKAKIFL